VPEYFYIKVKIINYVKAKVIKEISYAIGLFFNKYFFSHFILSKAFTVQGGVRVLKTK
jgi:hypothetical protein